MADQVKSGLGGSQAASDGIGDELCSRRRCMSSKMQRRAFVTEQGNWKKIIQPDDPRL